MVFSGDCETNFIEIGEVGGPPHGIKAPAWDYTICFNNSNDGNWKNLKLIGNSILVLFVKGSHQSSFDATWTTEPFKGPETTDASDF